MATLKEERNESPHFQCQGRRRSFILGSNDTNSGAAYVFEKPPGGWNGTLTQDAKLTASDANDNSQLGTSVTIENGTIASGAMPAEAVYVFV